MLSLLGEKKTSLSFLNGKECLVFARGESCFLLEYLAKICGRIKSASHGDIGHGVLTGSDTVAGGADFYRIEVFDERHAHFFGEKSAKMIFGDVKSLGNLLNSRNGIEMLVEITQDFLESWVRIGIFLRHVFGRVQKEENLK